jgi:cell division protein FtsB
VLGRVLRSDLLLGSVLIAVIVLGVLLEVPPFENYVGARQRVALLEQQAAMLEAENERLAQRLRDLEDETTVELLAREQQGLVRPGEVPYVLIPPPVERPRVLPAAPAPIVVAGDDDRLVRLLALLRRWFG